MQISYQDKKPTLYLVSTPIGNLKDITYRAIETLNNVRVVFAEDTRVSHVLFKRYKIETPLLSYHEHEKYEKISEVLKYLKNDCDVALISDAGTPGISDPGYELIKAVINEGYYVVSIPGVTAAIAALTSSGLAMQPHLFIGFLPRKQSEIRAELKKYHKVEASLIFYESPFRVLKTLNYLYEAYGKRKVVVARELTKLFETIIRTNLKEAVSLELKNKGEYIIIVEGNFDEVKTTETIESLYLKYQKENIDEKDILKMIATELKISKKEVYKKLKVD